VLPRKPTIETVSGKGDAAESTGANPPAEDTPAGGADAVCPAGTGVAAGGVIDWISGKGDVEQPDAAIARAAARPYLLKPRLFDAITGLGKAVVRSIRVNARSAANDGAMIIYKMDRKHSPKRAEPQ